jgi:hypothetical protein
MTLHRLESVIGSVREAGESLVASGREAGVSLLVLTSLALGLTALLGLGWGSSPLRLHPTGAAVWATVAAGFAYAEVRRSPHNSDRRFIATVALAVAAIALVEALVAILSFVPCGSRCI